MAGELWKYGGREQEYAKFGFLRGCDIRSEEVFWTQADAGRKMRNPGAVKLRGCRGTGRPLCLEMRRPLAGVQARAHLWIWEEQHTTRRFEWFGEAYEDSEGAEMRRLGRGLWREGGEARRASERCAIEGFCRVVRFRTSLRTFAALALVIPPKKWCKSPRGLPPRQPLLSVIGCGSHKVSRWLVFYGQRIRLHRPCFVVSNRQSYA